MFHTQQARQLYSEHSLTDDMSAAAERFISMSSFEQEPVSPMFRIDVSPEAESSQPLSNERMVVELLRQVVAGQQQQNRLIEDLKVCMIL